MPFALPSLSTFSVRHRLALSLTLAAWLLATGAQWDLVQTFAWARMFTDNVRTLPVGEGFARTFSPEGRCDICNAVSTAKEQQEKSSTVPDSKFGGKIFLIYQAAPGPVVTAPEFSPWSLSDQMVHTLGRAAPALRPPRV